MPRRKVQTLLRNPKERNHHEHRSKKGRLSRRDKVKVDKKKQLRKEARHAKQLINSLTDR